MNAERERNRAIYEEYQNGATYAELAKKYGVTGSRIKNLVQRELVKEQNRANKVFALLESLCDDEQLFSKTVTVLERIGATTEEKLLSLDRKILKKTRNCGPLMQDLIMDLRAEFDKKNVL